MGAIASGRVRVVNEAILKAMGVPEQELQAVTEVEERELARREQLYRGERPPLDVEGRTVILVDDGLATGSSVRAAILALRRLQPARIVVAVPVAAAETCEELRSQVDEMICAETPEPFYAVGLWYDDFSPTTDDEVRGLLDRAVRGAPGELREEVSTMTRRKS